MKQMISRHTESIPWLYWCIRTDLKDIFFCFFFLPIDTYDFDANRHLLKLYLFQPDMIKLDIVAKLLLKSLMATPLHFTALLNLFPSKYHTMDPIKHLIKWNSMLEQGLIKKFWNEKEVNKSVIEGIVGFDDAIRNCKKCYAVYMHFKGSIYSSLYCTFFPNIFSLLLFWCFNSYLSSHFLYLFYYYTSIIKRILEYCTYLILSLHSSYSVVFLSFT